MNAPVKSLILVAIVALACCLGNRDASAAAQAFDFANHPAYDDGWQSGDNGGINFGPWSLNTAFNTPSFGGYFIGDSANNGSSPSGDINFGGESFGLYANGGDIAVADRSFTGGKLLPGQFFSLSMDNGFIQNGSRVGFQLSQFPYGFGAPAFEFRFIGGMSNYFAIDAAGLHDTGVPFTDDGLNVDFLLTSATTYALAINNTPTLTGVLNGSDLLNFTLINHTAGSGGSNDAFFNSFAVANVPEPPTALPAIAALGWLSRRRRTPRPVQTS